jgi:hypothetical protein
VGCETLLQLVNALEVSKGGNPGKFKGKLHINICMPTGLDGDNYNQEQEPPWPRAAFKSFEDWMEALQYSGKHVQCDIEFFEM